MKRALYRLHLITSSLRTTGDAIESVTLPWSLLQSTGSLLSIGGFALFSHLPWVFLPPLLGKILDRTVKKVRLAFLALLIQALLAVLIVPLSSNVWAFYIIVSGISALDILHRYYGFSLIASMTLDESELQGLNAKLATLGNAVSLVAFPMAGLLAYRFGIGVMFIDALLLLFGALTLLPYLNVEVRENVGEVEAEKRMKLNLRLTIGVIVTVLLFNFALGSFRIFVFASLRVLWKGEVLYGILQSLTTVGSLVAVLLLAYLATRRLIGLKRPLTGGMFLQAFALIVVGFPSVLVLFPAVLLMGFGGGATQRILRQLDAETPSPREPRNCEGNIRYVCNARHPALPVDVCVDDRRRYEGLERVFPRSFFGFRGRGVAHIVAEARG